MKIEVVAYDPKWVETFTSEQKELQEKLGGVVHGIHHIGSTSIRGLAAKPIIDMLLEAVSLDALDLRAPALVFMGYEAMGEFGIAGRRYFRKGVPRRTHQVHAFQVGDPNIERHIAFRDYLEANPDILQAYAQLKQELAETCEDMDSYWEGKDGFIKLHEAKALEWRAGSSRPPRGGPGFKAPTNP